MPMAAVSEGRKPGRPRKYGQGRINATVRFTPEQYAALRAEADKHGRSVSEEVEIRIAESFNSGTLQDALATLDLVLNQMWELQQRLAATKRDAKRDEKRLAQIVEDAVARALMGGNR